jgi:hypothetical protein
VSAGLGIPRHGELGGTGVIAQTLVAGASGEEEAGPEPACGAALAARIHDRVVPRLRGVALALAAEGGLPAEAQRRCHDEITAALLELRALLIGPVAHSGPSLAQELQRWREAGVPLEVTRVDSARVPAELEGLVCDVLREALRNAMHHACPEALAVRIAIAAGCLVVSVINDGVTRPAGGARLGLGLPLAAAVAAEHDGRLEWRPLGESRWLVRLTVPVPGS